MKNLYSETVTFILMFAAICPMSLKAQDYLINFTATGESTVVTSVKVENLTKGTTLEISGSDVLHLTATITGIEPFNANDEKGLNFSPNPLKEFSRMKFTQHESGDVIVAIHDMAGKKIAEKKEFLLPGDHTFRITGINKGIYIVSVSSGKYSVSGKLVSVSSTGGAKDIVYEYENVVTDSKKPADSKGINNTVPMLYTSGDQLKVTGTGTGTSGMVATVGMMVPTSNGSYSFNFVSCIDGDDNHYPVVKIGPQVWMAENLKTTKYNDNTTLINPTLNLDWVGLTGGGYCWYNNDVANKPKFGGMYNWTAVASGKLCPTGWRMPTIDEWQTLAENTGGSTYSGGNLKETGFLYWNVPNEGATNQSGFSARAGGYRDSNTGAGSFHQIMTDGYWWSSTEYNVGSARCTYIHYYNAIIWDNNTNPKGFGLSVRCIKN